MKLAVVLFNLGGPDSLEAVEPFLRNLFSDPAIIRVPRFIRGLLARVISARRAPVARNIYAQMGGRSPILPETEQQGRALEKALEKFGFEARCFIAMRYWHPLIKAVVRDVKAWGPDHIVLLPLYPQYSTATTRSSREAWRKAAAKAKLGVPESEVCCYPTDSGFVTAVTNGVNAALTQAKPGISYRVLFSAHGLPKRMIAEGDPYQWQIEQSVGAVVELLARDDLDWRICYQSRVGPLKWIGPGTDDEIKRAGEDGKGLIVVPVAFVSEHSETLVELDIEYADLAREASVPDYVRVPTVRDHPDFISGLAVLVSTALNARGPISCAPGRLCPTGRICGQDPISARPAHA